MNRAIAVLGAVLVVSTLASPGTLAAGSPRVFATFSAHPVPGTGASAGGGGVLFDEGTASGIISSVDLADDETTHAVPVSWRLLSAAEVEICFEFIVVRGEAELPPGTVLCLPFPVGESIVLPNNVVVTVRLID